MIEAFFYEKLIDKKTKCSLCPKNCTIKVGKKGICMGKENIDGVLYASNYGLTTSLSIDPIEKKPLYHYYPGSNILSLGPNGCNLTCKFCQNWQISQVESPTKFISPNDAVSLAEQENSFGIAYTYSEPFIWYEYIFDTAKIAKNRGIKNVLVTNGFVNEIPLKKILPYIDAMNIDIKSMDNSFYKKQCGGDLDYVLTTIETASKQCHVEITNLIIPALNDTDDMFQKLSDFVGSIDPNIPLHFSRYFPQYKISTPATSVKTLEKAYDIASKKLNYVYVGNITSNSWNNTFCYNCKQIIIEREGYYVKEKNITNKHCSNCGIEVPLCLCGE